jgi:hypothetical protein
MEEMACDTQRNDEVNVGATVTQQTQPETQPEETVTQVNVTQQTQNEASNVGKCHPTNSE